MGSLTISSITGLLVITVCSGIKVSTQRMALHSNKGLLEISLGNILDLFALCIKSLL